MNKSMSYSGTIMKIGSISLMYTWVVAIKKDIVKAVPKMINFFVGYFTIKRRITIPSILSWKSVDKNQECTRHWKWRKTINFNVYF